MRDRRDERWAEVGAEWLGAQVVRYGNPTVMTVESLSDIGSERIAHCCWFDGETAQTHSFPLGEIYRLSQGPVAPIVQAMRVTLHSGGPELTVLGLDQSGHTALCGWRGETGVKRRHFRTSMLVPVPVNDRGRVALSRSHAANTP